MLMSISWRYFSGASFEAMGVDEYIKMKLAKRQKLGLQKVAVFNRQGEGLNHTSKTKEKARYVERSQIMRCQRKRRH